MIIKVPCCLRDGKKLVVETELLTGGVLHGMMTWLFALDNGPPCFSKLAFLSFFFHRFYRMTIQTNGGLRIVMESRDNGGRCYFRVLSNMKSVFFKVYDISTILVGNSLLSHHHLTLRKFHIKKPKGKKKNLYKRTKKYLSCFLNFFFLFFFSLRNRYQ